MALKPPELRVAAAVRDVMTTPVVAVRPRTPFKEIVDVLVAHRITGVPVVDADDHVVGMVTQTDLLAKEAYGTPPHRLLDLVADIVVDRDPSWRLKAIGQTAADVMTPRVLTVAPDDDLRRAARLMMEAHVTRLPVVEDGRLVGIVARTDALRLFHRDDAAIAADVRAVLANPTLTPEDHTVTASVDEGVVHLTGTVPFPPDVTVLEAVIGRLPGVVAVDSEIAARER